VEHPTRTSSQGTNKTGRTGRTAESPTGLSPKVDRRIAMSAEREVNVTHALLHLQFISREIGLFQQFLFQSKSPFQNPECSFSELGLIRK
jgi:hypothetical protein